MPRGIPLDLTPSVDRIDVTEILPSPPPAYSRLDDAAPNFEDADEGEPAAPVEIEADEDEDDEEDEDEDDLLEDDMYYEEDEEEDGWGGELQIDKQLVNDQDWENASGDLTKRYNRLRQHVGAVTGEQQRQLHGSGGSNPTGASSKQHGAAAPASSHRMPLPAQNQHSAQRAAALRAARIPEQGKDGVNGTEGIHASKLDSSLAQLSQRYASALNLAPVASTSANATASTSTAGGNHSYAAEPSFTSNAATRKGGSERHNTVKDKSDRATNEQVLDPRTRLVLFKMLNRGLLEKVEGCVSTGKEANVYHALGRMQPDAEPPSPLVHFAIKIYKTSILTFKARSKYLTGEFRFKNGYSKAKNPRKLVRLWAEKEMRNLRRLRTCGVRSPEPVEVRNNVLVMTFLGQSDDNWEACPRLKDAELPAERMHDLYIEMLRILRRMYKVCRLVHADLSEYNVIYNPNDEHLYTIDVSQSVEHDHPHAFDFLRSDIANVDEFFSRRGVSTLGIKRTFDFTIEDWGKIGDENEEEIAQEVERRLQTTLDEEEGQDEDAVDAAREKQDAEDQVFKQSYIPRTLNEVYDPERDSQRVAKGEREELIYANIAQVVGPQASATSAAKSVKLVSATQMTEQQDEENSEEVSASEESEDEDDEEGSQSDYDEDDDRPKLLKGKKHEDKDAKRERKQATKEEKREKRKEKIPKSVKKAKIKKSSGKRK